MLPFCSEDLNMTAFCGRQRQHLEDRKEAEDPTHLLLWYQAFLWCHEVRIIVEISSIVLSQIGSKWLILMKQELIWVFSYDLID